MYKRKDGTPPLSLLLTDTHTHIVVYLGAGAKRVAVVEKGEIDGKLDRFCGT